MLLRRSLKFMALPVRNQDASIYGVLVLVNKSDGTSFTEAEQMSLTETIQCFEQTLLQKAMENMASEGILVLLSFCSHGCGTLFGLSCSSSSSSLLPQNHFSPAVQ